MKYYQRKKIADTAYIGKEFALKHIQISERFLFLSIFPKIDLWGKAGKKNH